MRNKVTLDMMESCGCDCKCIISESDGTNTLELYMWSVSSEAAIVFSWTDPDGTGHSEGALGTFLDNGDYYYSANPEIFTGNRLITMTVNWGDFTSREIYFQCVNLTAETNFTVTRDLSADDLYRVAAATDDTLPIATTTSTGVVQIGSGLNVDETGVISTQIASKEALGIVKIGDGINVSEGTISLPPATFETLGGVKAGDNMLLGSDGMIGVPLATTKYPGVVQIGNGLNVDEQGVLSVGNLSPILTEYKYLTDLSVKLNGITYSITKDTVTGLISKISDNDGNSFEPGISAGITDVALHNAVFWAVAMARGFGNIKIHGNTNIFEYSNVVNGVWKNTGDGYDIDLPDSAEVTGEGVCLKTSNYHLPITDKLGDYTLFIVVKKRTDFANTAWTSVVANYGTAPQFNACTHDLKWSVGTGSYYGVYTGTVNSTNYAVITMRKSNSAGVFYVNEVQQYSYNGYTTPISDYLDIGKEFWFKYIAVFPYAMSNSDMTTKIAELITAYDIGDNT